MARARAILNALEGYDGKRMIDGICILLYDKIVCSVLRDLLIVRIGPQAHSEAPAVSHVA